MSTTRCTQIGEPAYLLPEPLIREASFWRDFAKLFSFL
jgi:hypothetical protein